MKVIGQKVECMVEGHTGKYQHAISTVQIITADQIDVFMFKYFPSYCLYIKTWGTDTGDKIERAVPFHSLLITAPADRDIIGMLNYQPCKC